MLAVSTTQTGVRRGDPKHKTRLEGGLVVHIELSSRGRTRTCDPAINSRLLYQLSYSGRDEENNRPEALKEPSNLFCATPV